MIDDALSEQSNNTRPASPIWSRNAVDLLACVALVHLLWLQAKPRHRRVTRGGRKRVAGMAAAQTTCCRWVPSGPAESVITSPRVRNTGVGLTPRPTPSGVPVMTKSPGSRVMNWLR